MPVQDRLPPKHRALGVAVAFALAWLVVLLAAADHPLQVGFPGLLPFLVLAAAFVYLAGDRLRQPEDPLPTSIDASRHSRRCARRTRGRCGNQLSALGGPTGHSSIDGEFRGLARCRYRLRLAQRRPGLPPVRRLRCGRAARRALRCGLASRSAGLRPAGVLRRLLARPNSQLAMRDSPLDRGNGESKSDREDLHPRAR